MHTVCFKWMFLVCETSCIALSSGDIVSVWPRVTSCCSTVDEDKTQKVPATTVQMYRHTDVYAACIMSVPGSRHPLPGCLYVLWLQFELRYEEVARARHVFEKYVEILPGVKVSEDWLLSSCCTSVLRPRSSERERGTVPLLRAVVRHSHRHRASRTTLFDNTNHRVATTSQSPTAYTCQSICTFST